MSKKTEISLRIGVVIVRNPQDCYRHWIGMVLDYTEYFSHTKIDK